MKKIFNIILKVVFSLLLILLIVGMFDVMPAPTRDLYSTDLAFDFIMVLISVGYINIIMGVVALGALIALWTKRVLLSGLLMLPITVSIFGFHLCVDGGLFTGGAVMANVFFLINLYFVYQQRSQLAVLFRESN